MTVTWRTAGGGGFDTTSFASAVSCLATHKVNWLGVSGRARRRFSFGVSEQERRVSLEFAWSLFSRNGERTTVFTASNVPKSPLV